MEVATDNPLIQKLQGLAPLSALDVAALKKITSQPRLVQARMDLIEEDDVSDNVFIFLGGFACRYKQRRTGARQIVSYLLPGDVCDVNPVDLPPLDHAVCTLATSNVARIPRRAWIELLQEHPHVAQASRLAKRIEDETTRMWLVNLGCRSALERMAHLFCELMTRMEAVGLARDGTCPLPLIQADLGQTLGLSNVHVNRVLQEMRRLGLIDCKGKTLRLLDQPRLRHLAEFSADYLQLRPRRTV